MLGVGKILIILLVIALLFGRKLPQLGANIGKMINNFKKETKGFMDGIKGKSGD